MLFDRRVLNYEDVLGALNKKGIAIRVASPKLVMEEVSDCSSIWSDDSKVTIQ